MPNKCCISTCKIQADDPEGLHLSFHKVPADEALRNKWLENIIKHCHVEFRKYSYVCGLHFTSDCFVTSSSGQIRSLLKKGSCPTIFLASRHHKKQCIAGQNEDIYIEIENPKQMGNNTSNIASAEIIETVNDEILYTDSTCDQERNDTCSITEVFHLSPHKDVNADEDYIASSQKSTVMNNNQQIGKSNSSIIYKKSLAMIDLNSIDYGRNSVPMLRRLLYNAQSEIIRLRKNIKSKNMKIYRYKKMSD